MKMKLAEMVDADVQFVSLVTTGANGQPIKRMKAEQESDVIHNRDVFKTGGSKPRLIAIAVGAGGDVEAAKTIAKAAGIEIVSEREAGETTLLLPDEAARINTDSETQVVVQLASELAMVCEVSKTFSPFNGSTSFAEAVKSQNFFPQLRGALETFGEVAFNVMSEADSNTNATEMIQKAGGEFVEMLVGMTQALPSDVFKMDEVLTAVSAPADEPEALAASETEPETAEETETVEDQTEIVVKGDTGDLEVIKNDDGTLQIRSKVDGNGINMNVNVGLGLPPTAPVIPSPAEAEFSSSDGVDNGSEPSNQRKTLPAPTGTPSMTPAPAAKSEEEPKEEAAKADETPAWATALIEGQTALKTSIETLSDRVDEIEDTAGEAVETAKAADTAVTGRVQVEERDGDSRAKSAREGHLPLIDTALTRQRQKWAS